MRKGAEDGSRELGVPRTNLGRWIGAFKAKEVGMLVSLFAVVEDTAVLAQHGADGLRYVQMQAWRHCVSAAFARRRGATRSWRWTLYSLLGG